MPSSLQLTREQLARFLPNHEAIKAFEDLLILVSDNLPVSEGELAALVAGIPRVNTDAFRRVVDELTQQQSQRFNANSIERRLAAIEAYLGIQA